MGRILNPNNNDYKIAINSPIYVDKTNFIEHTNGILSTEQRFLCVSRPRRFGKSMTANMLVAYYSMGCDSKELFSKFKIAECESFERHLNKYNVIHINMTDYCKYSDINDMIDYLSQRILHELKNEYGEVDCFDWTNLSITLDDIYAEKGIQFVFIIDEWDCVLRTKSFSLEDQTIYLNFLRDLLKDKSYVALAYMTGILPIKKYGAHSAINMFTEVSMTNASPYEEFTGFTVAEVESLCEQYNKDYLTTKSWYNGYNVNGEAVYNPKSVVESICRNNYNNYWTSTETYYALKDHIKLNFDGLKDKISAMIAGSKVPVNTAKFQNDMTSLNSADDVLTLLIHLGYLTYNATTVTGKGEVWIPNNEVYQEFVNSIEDGGWEKLVEELHASEKLLEATLNCDAELVAKMMESYHAESTSILKYNDENSLACALTIAYYSAKNKYIIHRELATGKGFADMVFIPMKNVDLPALIVELKHNKSSDTAIDQIKNKNYSDKISEYTGDILLVGISYDDEKNYTCKIEKVSK